MRHEDAWEGDCGEHSPEEDDEGPRQPAVIADPEVWMDYYSEELLDLWYAVQNYAVALGPVLDACAFSDFASFCFRHSSGRPPRV